jgi:hypothetical protein
VWDNKIIEKASAATTVGILQRTVKKIAAYIGRVRYLAGLLGLWKKTDRIFSTTAQSYFGDTNSLPWLLEWCKSN